MVTMYGIPKSHNPKFDFDVIMKVKGIVLKPAGKFFSTEIYKPSQTKLWVKHVVKLFF